MECLNSSLKCSFLWFSGDHQYNHPILSSATQTPAHGERWQRVFCIPSSFQAAPSHQGIRHSVPDSLKLRRCQESGAHLPPGPQCLTLTFRSLSPQCSVSDIGVVFHHEGEKAIPFLNPFLLAVINSIYPQQGVSTLLCPRLRVVPYKMTCNLLNYIDPPKLVKILWISKPNWVIWGSASRQGKELRVGEHRSISRVQKGNKPHIPLSFQHPATNSQLHVWSCRAKLFGVPAQNVIEHKTAM